MNHHTYSNDLLLYGTIATNNLSKEASISRKTKGLVKRHYWAIAGTVIGIASVMGAWINFKILVGSGDLTLLGASIVVLEYTIVVTVLGAIYNRLNV